MKTPHYFVIVLLSTILGLVLFAACKAADVMNADDQASAAQLEAEVEIEEARAEETEEAFVAAATEVKEAFASGNQDLFDAAMTRFEDARETHLAQLERLTAKELEYNDLLNAAKSTTDKTWTSALSSIPVAGPLLGALVPLGTTLLFDRNRKNVGKLFKNLTQKKVIEALGNVAAILGYRHSTQDPEELVMVATKKAAKKGDEDLVNRLVEVTEERKLTKRAHKPTLSPA